MGSMKECFWIGCQNQSIYDGGHCFWHTAVGDDKSAVVGLSRAYSRLKWSTMQKEIIVVKRIHSVAEALALLQEGDAS